jgi:hypothetical protein
MITADELADALRVFLECYESTRDHGGGWPKYVPDNAREALAAYDAQHYQESEAHKFLRVEREKAKARLEEINEAIKSLS